MPNERAAARTKRSRRVNSMYERTRMPEVATDANRKVVTPPRTGSGTTGECQTARVAFRTTARTGKEDARDLAQDTEKDEEHAAESSRHTVGTARDCNNAVVLGRGQGLLGCLCGAELDHPILTCAKIDSGVTVNKADRNPPIPSLWTHGQPFVLV